MLSIIALLLIAVFAIAYAAGRSRAVAVAGGNIHTLHSRPSYHGGYLALWATVPALLLLAAWAILSGSVIDEIVL